MLSNISRLRLQYLWLKTKWSSYNTKIFLHRNKNVKKKKYSLLKPFGFFSSCSFKSCFPSQGFVSSSNSLFSGLSFQMMPIKGKGKISKQTNKLESIDSIAAAFNIGLPAAEPFLTCRVLINSKQRKCKQTNVWGVYLVHLIYCFYWKEKLRLTWKHSSVQCQVCCRSNTRPDCLFLTFVRGEKCCVGSVLSC